MFFTSSFGNGGNKSILAEPMIKNFVSRGNRRVFYTSQKYPRWGDLTPAGRAGGIQN